MELQTFPSAFIPSFEKVPLWPLQGPVLDVSVMDNVWTWDRQEAVQMDWKEERMYKGFSPHLNWP